MAKKNLFVPYKKLAGSSIMGYQQKTVEILDKFARNLKPTHTVMAIATVKGICRPAFTMMDKKEKPETKKYTALREGITEAVAIPIYFICGELAGLGAKCLTKARDNAVIAKAKKAAKDAGDVFDVASAEKLKLPVHVTSKIANNLRFLGVCAAALVAIPATCSVVIKPVVDKIITTPSQRNIPQAQGKVPIKQISRPTLNSFIGNHGLRVGGV